MRSGRLEIGVSPFAGYYILPGALADFRSTFPAVSISVISGNTTEILGDLKKGNVEMIILGKTFPAAKDPVFTYRSLCSDRLVLVAPRGHAWASNGRASLEETRNNTLIRFSGDCPLANYVDEFLLRNRIFFGEQVETDEIEIAKGLAEAGIGVLITSSLSAQSGIASGQLVPVMLDGMDDLFWEIQCVYSSSKGLSYPGWEMVKRPEANCREVLL